jgi:hypothetical protein
MGVLPQALEILFEMQRKRSNEKITRKKKKKSFPTHKLVFFFSFLWPVLFSKFLTFSFFVHLKRFKEHDLACPERFFNVKKQLFFNFYLKRI